MIGQTKSRIAFQATRLSISKDPWLSVFRLLEIWLDLIKSVSTSNVIKDQTLHGHWCNNEKMFAYMFRGNLLILGL